MNSRPVSFVKHWSTYPIITLLLCLATVVALPVFSNISWAANAKRSTTVAAKRNHKNIRRLSGLRKKRQTFKGVLRGMLQKRHVFRAQVHQIMAHNFDWDDNVIKMPTLIYLTRNSDGKEFSFTTEEFAALRSKVGDDKEWTADYDDHKNGAIRDFRDYSQPHRFRMDTKKAQQNGAWAENAKRFQEHLNSPITARWTFVTTTRGHGRNRLYEGVSHLFREGFLRFLMPIENLVGITYPEGLDVAGAPMPQIALDDRKTFTHEQRLNEITKVPLGKKAIELVTPDGDATQAMHSYEFSDDDQGYFEATVNYFKEHRHKWPNVKLIVSYTGELDIKSPRRVVITSSGKTRELGKSLKGDPLPQELNEVERSVASQEK